MGRHTQTINCKVLLVCLLVAVCRGAPTTSQDEDDDDDGFKDVRVTISALDDVISWAKAHHYLLIVDFLFSIRVAQGEVDTSLLSAAPRNRPPDIDMRLQILQEKLNKLADIAFDKPPPPASDEYFHNFVPLISQKYYISDRYRTKRHLSSLPKHEAAPDQYPETYDEMQSDKCMLEILGSKDTRKCRLSRSCFSQMTNDKSEDYQLTHQLIYFMLAEMHGCGEQLERLCQSSGTKLMHLIDKFAIKTYKRMPSILDSGRYDLFLEMVMVGQMFNFEEFHQPSLRKLLFLWHEPTGCYNDERKASENLQLKTNHIGRKLLADELIDDSCSEHMTALALIVISLTLNNQLDSATSIDSNYLEYHVLLLVGIVFLGIVYYMCLKKRKLRLMRYSVVEFLGFSVNSK